MKSRPRLLMALAAIVFGTIPLFTRSIPLPSAEIALSRAVLAALLLALIFLLRRRFPDRTALKKALLPLLLSGAAMGFNWILLFEAYRYTTIAAATLSYYFAPVLVMILSPLLFRDRMSGRQIICAVMATLGLALVIGLPAEGITGLKGIGFGLGAAVLYATVMLINRATPGLDGLLRSLIQFIAASAALLPYVLLTGGLHLSQMDGTGWICLLILGLIHTGAAYVGYFIALRDLPGQAAAMLSYLDPLTAMVVSTLILGEAVTPLQWVGGALLLGFTLLNELGGHRAESAGQPG